MTCRSPNATSRAARRPSTRVLRAAAVRRSRTASRTAARGLIESGVELRRQNVDQGLGLRFRESLFLDAGEVTETAAQLDTDPAKWNLALGTGLQFEIVKSIVVRLDVGYRLNRTGPDESRPAPTPWDRIAFHLGVGQAY